MAVRAPPERYASRANTVVSDVTTTKPTPIIHVSVLKRSQ